MLTGYTVNFLVQSDQLIHKNKAVKFMQMEKDKTYPIYYDGTMSEERLKELKEITQRSKEFKLDDDVRRLLSGNPYPWKGV